VSGKSATISFTSSGFRATSADSHLSKLLLPFLQIRRTTCDEPYFFHLPYLIVNDISGRNEAPVSYITIKEVMGSLG
jgi:hypothetical protein